MTNLCDVCGKPATQSMLRDPFGKSDEMRFVCSHHGFRIRDPADVAAIEQLHAAVKTAQELAATRLMEIERLQSNQREHIQEITELTQNRDDYKADYLRMHKMFMDLKYPDTVPAHEPGACTSRESDWCCTHCGRDNDPTESHCVHCEWSRKHTVAGVLHERGCEDNPCRCGALKSPGASRDASGYHCLDCGADLSNHPTAASAHRCSPSRTGE